MAAIYNRRVRDVTRIGPGFIFGLLLLLLVFSAYGRVNLPHLDTQTPVADMYHQELKAFFVQTEESNTVRLDENIERILIEMLPAEFATGCDETVMHWGSSAENIPDLAVRAIYRRKVPEIGRTQVLLVYRCFSHYEYYVDKFYDERTAWLTIDDSVSTLQMLPHGEDCENCSDLSKISLENTLQAGREPLLAVVFSVSNDNPCCGGPYSYRAEYVHYYLVEQGGLRQVASVTRLKQEHFHDDAGEDLEVLFETAVELLTNSDGDVVEIVGQRVTKENEKITESGEDRYLWNQQLRKFEKVSE